MINKRISKITMLTALFVAGVVNAQEFYTCVPKKDWYNNSVNFPSVNELAEAIAKGIKDSKKDPWSLVSTIDFRSILNDNNLNQNNIPVFNTYLSYGNYKFRLILKSKDKTILKKFENIVNINKNAKLFFDVLSYSCHYNNLTKIKDFYNKYNLDQVIFLQDRDLINLPTCDSDYRIGIGLLRLENKVLFSYEHISTWSGSKLYDENFIVNNEQVNDNNHYWLSQNPLNIFRYSTLEIYKQNDS